MTGDNPVARYCRLYVNSSMGADAFAFYMLTHHRELCIRVLEEIGSWPSSERELRALQKRFTP